MIWISQAQYDGMMRSVSKLESPDLEDLREIDVLVPPFSDIYQLSPSVVPNRKLLTARFYPALRNPDQDRSASPELIWKLKTQVQICEEWLAKEMQSP